MKAAILTSVFLLATALCRADSSPGKGVFPMQKPLTRSGAEEIAKAYLNADGNGHQMTIMPELTQEEDFGFVVFYAPKKFIETRDPRYAVPGNGPLVIDRADHKAHPLPTSLDPKSAIDEYRKRRKEKPPQ